MYIYIKIRLYTNYTRISSLEDVDVLWYFSQKYYFVVLFPKVLFCGTFPKSTLVILFSLFKIFQYIIFKFFRESHRRNQYTFYIIC